MGSQLFNFKISKDKPVLGTSKGIKAKVPMAERPAMSTAVFEELRDVIYSQCGIYYTESKKYLLEGRISKRLGAKKMRNYEEYVKFLKSPFSRQEMNHLFEAVTINETYFFRAESQFVAFEDVIVPEILDKKNLGMSPIFRIWSAASSTGEESYTLALIIAEKLKPKYPNVQFQIVASDINTAVIQKAKKGIFKDYSVRNIPPNYMKKYFTKQGGEYILNPDIRKMVRFVNMNLYDSTAIRSMSGCDVIFCANVLIYFDIPSKQKVVSSMFDSLNRGGYLFIGYSESLHGVSKAFKLIHLPKAMAYKKE